jgi:hypothetical protein
MLLWLATDLRRRYDEAIAVLERVAVAQPNFSSVHVALWGAYYKKQMLPEAMGEAVRFEALNDRETMTALQSGYREGGYRAGMKRAADTVAWDGEALRPDPRFQDLLRRMGLPQ